MVKIFGTGVNGNLWFKTNYKDGKKDGKSVRYYENGVLFEDE